MQQFVDRPQTPLELPYLSASKVPVLLLSAIQQSNKIPKGSATLKSSWFSNTEEGEISA